MPSAQAADRTVSELIPVGQTVGVKLFSDGVLVVGFSDGESPAKDCGLKEGDVITAIGGQSLDTIEEFRQLLAENGEDAAALTVKRGSRTIELSAEPEKDEDGEYRLGAWVRDSMAGIGTMTFYDPQSGTFGALGHGVTDVDTGQLLPLDHGSIMDASVKAVKKGERASPGELKGDFDLTRDSGTLYANTECGIFGKLSAEDAAKIVGAALPIAKRTRSRPARRRSWPPFPAMKRASMTSRSKNLFAFRQHAKFAAARDGRGASCADRRRGAGNERQRDFAGWQDHWRGHARPAG